jgi:glutathione S-transferase
MSPTSLTSVTIYYAPMTRASRVLWALEELGVPYEKVKLDLAKGEHKKPEYLALNPNGTVPTLVVDGVSVMESSAQIMFLAETFGVTKKLWPAEGTTARAEALGWMVWMTETLGGALMRYAMNTSERVPAEERNALVAKKAHAELLNAVGMLEKRLAKNDWLLGNDFTLLDTGCGGLVFATRFLGVDLSAYPKALAWMQRATSRPAYQTAQSL